MIRPKWWTHRHQLRNSVRYRLVTLTSIPLFLTFIALVAITTYWSVNYTWKNTLTDIAERLTVANNSFHLLEHEQEDNVRALGASQRFHEYLRQNHSDAEITKWLHRHKDGHPLDFISYVSSGSTASLRLNTSHLGSHLTVLSPFEIEKLAPRLVSRVEIPIIDEERVERRAMVGVTTVPVMDKDNVVIGYLQGGRILNNSTSIVDAIRTLIYPITANAPPMEGAVTIMLDDLRISTNVPLSNSGENSKRAIGTRVSEEVKQRVLVEGQEWVDLAFVYNDWYVSAYRPLKDQHNNIIGMLYTGYRMWPILQHYLPTISVIVFLLLFTLIVSGFWVYIQTNALLLPIQKISLVVNAISHGEHQRIGEIGLGQDHELTRLARQFDLMLDTLEEQNNEIKRFVKILEVRVEQRTISLHEKARQLQHHIDLLNRTRDQLVAKEKFAALGELTAGIAHEINNPIAVILGNAELIKFQLSAGNDNIEEELEAIYRQVNRIRTITSSLLQYSKQQPVNTTSEWQNIESIVEESITLVKTGDNKRNIKFVCSFAATRKLKVSRNQLLQVLINIEMNAIQAMDGQGTLTISTGDNKHDEGVFVTIKDEGEGISPEVLSRIYDPFFTTKKEGTGLGLAVSRNIISQIGGQLEVKSTLNVGTEFTLFLPYDADDRITETSDPSSII